MRPEPRHMRSIRQISLECGPDTVIFAAGQVGVFKGVLGEIVQFFMLLAPVGHVYIMVPLRGKGMIPLAPGGAYGLSRY